MKKYLLLFTVLFSVSIFAQTPTPAKSYTKFLKLKQYRSGAMNVADSLNWNYDQIDTTLRYVYNGLNISMDSVKHYYTYIDSVFTEIHQTEDTLQFQAGQIVTLNENMGNLNGTVLALESTVTLLDTAINLESVERVNADTVLSGRITVNNNKITQEVTDRTNQGNELSSSITNTANEIQIKSSMNSDTKASLTVGNINGGTVKIAAKNIQIDGNTTFANGYDPSNKLGVGDAAGDINSHTTTINGDKITTGTITALGNVTAGSFNLGNGTFSVIDGILTAKSANFSGSITSSTFTTGQSMGEPGSGNQVDIAGNNITISAFSAPSYSGYTSLTATGLVTHTQTSAYESETSVTPSYVSTPAVTLNGNDLQTTLNGKASASHSHAIGGEGAPVGDPGNNMTYYDATNNRYYVNFGGSWVEIHP